MFSLVRGAGSDRRTRGQIPSCYYSVLLVPQSILYFGPSLSEFVEASMLSVLCLWVLVVRAGPISVFPPDDVPETDLGGTSLRGKEKWRK